MYTTVAGYQALPPCDPGYKNAVVVINLEAWRAIRVDAELAEAHYDKWQQAIEQKIWGCIMATGHQVNVLFTRRVFRDYPYHKDDRPARPLPKNWHLRSDDKLSTLVYKDVWKDIDTLRPVIYFYISDSPTEKFPLLWEAICLHPKVEAAHYMRFDEIDPELIYSEQQLSLTWIYNQPPTEYFCQQRITQTPGEFECAESVSSVAAETSSEETSNGNLTELSQTLGLAGIAPAHSQEEFPSFLKRALDIYDKDEQPFHLFLKKAIAVYENKEKLTKK